MTAADDALGEAVQFALDLDLYERAAWAASVDRAVAQWQGILAAEAVGHFLRHGRPGPSMFVAPPLRDSA